MKKTFISIIGIMVMLLAITACRPNYVIVPLPDNNSSGTVPSGTPVANKEQLMDVLNTGEEARLLNDIELDANDLAGMTKGTINADGKKIKLTGNEPVGGPDGIKTALLLNGTSLKNAIIDVETATNPEGTLSRAGSDAPDFAIVIRGTGTTLENVTINTGNKTSGINIHTADGVTLRNVTIDNCLRAPINISSSKNVIIDGIKASGSEWYGKDNVIQVNGIGGKPKVTASEITFQSTGNINKVWVEAVETYNEKAGITDQNFEDSDQNKINGLDSWAVRFSNQASKGTKGWMYYAQGQEDASTFTLNLVKDTTTNSEAELKAMIAAVTASADDHKYSTIKLSGDINTTNAIVVPCKVTLDLNEKTIANTSDIWEISGYSLITLENNADLTITGNGKLDAKENDCYAFDVDGNSKLTIKNGEIIGNVSAVYVLNGHAEILGGTFSIKQKDEKKETEFTLNCYDPAFEDGTASISVSGGTFINFDPFANLAESETYDNNFGADGCKSTCSEIDGNKIYTVSPK